MFTEIKKNIAGFLLLCIVILVFLAAILRWIGISVAWSIDFAQLLFVWVSFLGADIALGEHKHIGVDIIEKKLPFKSRQIILLINYTIIIVFLSLIIYYGTVLSVNNYRRSYNTIPISYSWATFSAPFGALLMFITTIKNMIDIFSNKEEK